MADAAEVFAGITRKPDIRYTALVPNIAGLERAVQAGVPEIAVFAAATESSANHALVRMPSGVPQQRRNEEQTSEQRRVADNRQH